MFMILLSFTKNRDKAGEYMESHRAWIAEAREDGVFLLVGSLAGGTGGAILADGESRTEMETRVARDPFVREGVVEAEIHEFTPSLADERLQFLAA